jgi:hypothetical protein
MGRKEIYTGTSLEGMNRVPDIYQARERLIRGMTTQAEMQMDQGTRAPTAQAPNLTMTGPYQNLYAGVKNKAIRTDRNRMPGTAGPSVGVAGSYMMNDLF